MNNKENNSRACNTSRTTNSHHPSDQSQCTQYRPSIKVGYQVVSYLSEQKEKRMAIRRKIQPKYQCQQRANCKKMLTQSSQGRVQASGKFINSEYIKQQTKQEPAFSKKSVQECRQKNQSSEQIKNNLIAQFNTHNSSTNNSRRSCSVSAFSSNSINTNNSNTPISQSRSQLNQLPSYKKAGIKDIMEYQHARPYREIAVTQKCTKSNAISRFFKYQDLHQFDFRKRPQFLR